MVSVVFFMPAIHQKGACTIFCAPRRSIRRSAGAESFPWPVRRNSHAIGMHIAHQLSGTRGSMLYQSFQAFTDLAHPVRAMAAALSRGMGTDWATSPIDHSLRKLAATYELIALGKLTHSRPDFGISAVAVNGREVAVREEVIHATPFGSLLRFRKEMDACEPRVLLVAPLSGHFATLLRGTVQTLLADHDVYITDWHNPRDVPLSAGRLGPEEYVLHLVEFIEHMGPGGHVVAVCQPTVATLAAVAGMAEGQHPAQPPSLTLMAGPVQPPRQPAKGKRLPTNP